MHPGVPELRADEQCGAGVVNVASTEHPGEKACGLSQNANPRIRTVGRAPKESGVYGPRRGDDMTLCPIALAVHCTGCPIVKVCPAKRTLGDYETYAPTPVASESGAKADAPVPKHEH